MIKTAFTAIIASLAATSVSGAAIQQTDADVQRLLKEYDACQREGAQLDARIQKFNKRAIAFKTKSEKATTGTRISNGGAGQPVITVRLRDETSARLHQESVELTNQRTAHWNRCKKFNTRADADKKS